MNTLRSSFTRLIVAKRYKYDPLTDPPRMNSVRQIRDRTGDGTASKRKSYWLHRLLLAIRGNHCAPRSKEAAIRRR